MITNYKKVLCCFVLTILYFGTYAQKQTAGVVDKTVAVVGNEMITLSEIEQEVRMLMAQQGNYSKNIRCELLEQLLDSKLFLVQARVDSLSLNNDMVEGNLNQRIDQVRSQLGGDEAVEEYFGKPLYRLRQDWKKQLEDMNLTQQARSKIAAKIPPLTPFNVKQYIDTVDKSNLPIIPVTYRLSQIVIYPDREQANLAVKERLISMRERIINGEKFSMLARLYSEDIESAKRGGELGLASKSIFWPAFSDAAMSLKPGIISQVVETPDGFHLIEVLEKKGDMFNARHILLKANYTSDDKIKAFKRLDSIKTAISEKRIDFERAAIFYSEDIVTRTNGGQMADPNTGSTYFEIDKLKPAEYQAIKDLKEGDISQAFESTDNDGRDNGRYITGKTCYKIIRVDKIIPSHIANFEKDYSSLQEKVEYVLQMREIENFLKEKIKTTYVVIDPMFKDCKFEKEAWKTKF